MATGRLEYPRNRETRINPSLFRSCSTPCYQMAPMSTTIAKVLGAIARSLILDLSSSLSLLNFTDIRMKKKTNFIILSLCALNMNDIYDGNTISMINENIYTAQRLWQLYYDTISISGLISLKVAHVTLHAFPRQSSSGRTGRGVRAGQWTPWRRRVNGVGL